MTSHTKRERERGGGGKQRERVSKYGHWSIEDMCGREVRVSSILYLSVYECQVESSLYMYILQIQGFVLDQHGGMGARVCVCHTDGYRSPGDNTYMESTHPRSICPP